jgi:CTP synthase (UTP-ammonia lyase)
MERSVRVVVVGDYDPEMYTHRGMEDALRHVRGAGRQGVAWEWLHTTRVTTEALSVADALWIAPASPYASLEGALTAIRHGREHRVPTLAICGGFQHVVIEFLRNVSGVADAAHGEIDPDAEEIAITPLSCSLVGRTGAVFFEADSQIAAAYGRWRSVERYHCRYGLNECYLDRLQAHGLRVTGRDDEGSTRALELAAHPFFIATLFQPQLASRQGEPAPLVRALVDAAARERGRHRPDIAPAAPPVIA